MISFVAVLNELEGLARGADARDCPPASRAALNPEHVARVAESAKAALAFARSRNPAIRCLTTRGTVLTSSTFTVEEDVDKVSEKGERERQRFDTLTLGLLSNCIRCSSGYLEGKFASIVDRSRICDEQCPCPFFFFPYLSLSDNFRTHQSILYAVKQII